MSAAASGPWPPSSCFSLGGIRRRRAGSVAPASFGGSVPVSSNDGESAPPRTSTPPLHAVRQAASTPPGLGLSATAAAAGHAPPPQGLGNSLPPGGIRRLTATPPWRGSAAGADSSPAPFPFVSTAGARPPSVPSLTCAHKMTVLACCAERRKDEVGEVLSAPRQFYTRSCCWFIFG